MFDFDITLVDLFLTCYDNEGGEATGDEQGGNSEDQNAGNPPIPAPANGKALTQAEVDKIVEDRLKRERKKAQGERETLARELEALKAKGAGLTEAEKQELTDQIEKLKTAHLSAEEKARLAKSKADKEWEQKHQLATAERDSWKKQYEEYRVLNEIQSAALEAGASPQSLRFFQSLLGPQTRLAPEVGDDGKPVGTHTARVRMQGKKDGKSVDLDFTVPDAVKYMKDSPEEYGMLFLSDLTPGLGGNNGASGKKPSVNSEMSMEEYLKLRASNPKGLGLVK